MFSNPITAKELPQEFARFARVDKSYMKMTKRAHDTKNVLQVTINIPPKLFLNVLNVSRDEPGVISARIVR